MAFAFKEQSNVTSSRSLGYLAREDATRQSYPILHTDPITALIGLCLQLSHQGYLSFLCTG